MGFIERCSLAFDDCAGVSQSYVPSLSPTQLNILL